MGDAEPIENSDFEEDNGDAAGGGSGMESCVDMTFVFWQPANTAMRVVSGVDPGFGGNGKAAV